MRHSRAQSVCVCVGSSGCSTRAHRISVLTFAVLISYILRTASVIWRLFARTSTMKTSVLLSSIFFIADSVVSGYLRIEN
jgi:hypothetical protein